ncbi:sensor histidine kinase [Zeaxanthinibacter enoshimensis]|uniref:sensor histidine kinase n=1 Tax=Zeaxanthinibacter enoshimensis TaxID=392009 RepID=UPI00356B16BB
MLKYAAFIFFSLLIVLQATAAQDYSGDNNMLKRFKETEDPTEKFNFFFDSPNRYNDNSAYDWLDVVNSYLNITEKVGDSLASRQFRLMQAQIYYDMGDYDKSIAIANVLYASKDTMQPETREVLLDLMDETYAQLQFFDKQIDIRKEKRELGLTENIAFYDIYSNLGLHRKAMNDYIMEVKKTIAEDDFYGLAAYHNNVGNYLRLDKSPSTAITNLSKAKGFIEVYLNDLSRVKTEKEIVKGKILRGVIEGNIGKCYVQLGQYREAIPYLENGIAIIDENLIGQYSSDVVENSLALAEAHLQLENYETAKRYLEKNFQFKKVENILKRNRLLAAYYNKTQDFRNESFYLRKNFRLLDSIDFNESSIKKQQLVAVVAQEDLANSRRMIDAQKLEMERARSEMQAKDERINLVFISLIFTLLGFAGLVYAYLKSIKNQRLIAEQKHIIENSLVEKDSLLKEIHHRVKNNLQMVSSLLSLQTKNTRSKAAIEALEEGKSRVKAMALIHQKLYQNDDLSVIEMQGYIESLVNSVQSVFKKGGHNINITIDAEGVELDIDRAIPFGLILNELVSNSFKYAFPENMDNGKIYIHLRKNGEQGFFEYTDNGVGLSEDSDERASSSMGIRLMNRLVNQLQSTLNIDNTTEGVRFWFNFK